MSVHPTSGPAVSSEPQPVDPLSPTVNPAELDALRSGCPVSRTERGWWYLARHDDVLAATEDIPGYRASFRDPGVVVPDEEQFINEIPEPRHGEIRRLINSAIATHRLTRVEPFCRELCGELLDAMRESGTANDLTPSYIEPIPNNVIARLLGAEPTDYPRWLAWSEELVRGTYPTQYRNERGAGLAGAHPEFTAYVDALIADRRAEPRDDFVTRLLDTVIEGRRLTDVEARTQLVFLFISGNETTRHLIGNLLYRLAADPGLFATLSADRSLIPAAVEESLRLDPPVRFLLRDCTEARAPRGVPIVTGDKVVFGIEPANRDPERFEAPTEFRLDRGPDSRRHLSFGGGPHVCPGALLARLEARVAVEELLTRATGMRLRDGHAFENVPTFWARGPQSVPVDISWR
ncbi:cytochrome P450 [Yinghuangia sp. YIM S09857]|uniref:cytochrome P450 n=1 Tax=Yinghuangia sp. YIM S09857 TaxID=3436929 RepID=UPI003F52B927